MFGLSAFLARNLRRQAPGDEPESALLGLLGSIDAVRLNLASAEEIRSWSGGEVRHAIGFDERDGTPVEAGLFCTSIFGESRQWRCECGNLVGNGKRGVACDVCDEYPSPTQARRGRLGHIELAAAVVHPWFNPHQFPFLSLLLGLSPETLQGLAINNLMLVFEPGNYESSIAIEDWSEPAERIAGSDLQALTGAEAIRQMLRQLDLDRLARQLRAKYAETESSGKKAQLQRRMEIVEPLRVSGNRPEWIVLDVIPVLSPEDRRYPGIQRRSCRNLEALYGQLLRMNSELKSLLDLDAPEAILRGHRRKLQSAVNALFDRVEHPSFSRDKDYRRRISLTERLMERRYAPATGKTVDFSARSVLVPDPNLGIDQCGLPQQIARELYRPFIVRDLVQAGFADSVSRANHLWRKGDNCVWQVLERRMRHHPVLVKQGLSLNPSAMQSLYPVLVGDNAIHINPIWASVFDSQFEGTQAAVYLPLSSESQKEAVALWEDSRRLLDPTHGDLALLPTPQAVLGCTYLTLEPPNLPGRDVVFGSPEEAIAAWQHGAVAMHAAVRVRIGSPNSKIRFGNVDRVSVLHTTVGRVLFNETLPDEMHFFNDVVSHRSLKEVFQECLRQLGATRTVKLVEKVERLGLEHVTASGLSIGVSDLTIGVKKKGEAIAEAEKLVDKAYRIWDRGMISRLERYDGVLDAWTKAQEQIAQEIGSEPLEQTGNQAAPPNPYLLALKSGVGAVRGQIDRLVGMIGLRPTSADGSWISEVPIKSNCREGLQIHEYFGDLIGGRHRRSLMESQQARHDCWTLAYRLAGLLHEVVIAEDDCGCRDGIAKSEVWRRDSLLTLGQQIVGRVTLDEVVDPLSNRVLARPQERITPSIAAAVDGIGRRSLNVRSPITCQAAHGVCARCYGTDVVTGEAVERGTAIGVTAALALSLPARKPWVERWRRKLRAILEPREIHDPRTGSVDYSPRRTRTGGLEIVTRKSGRVKYDDLSLASTASGAVVLEDAGVMVIEDMKGRALERHRLPVGAKVIVEERQEVAPGSVLYEWEESRDKALARAAGTIHLIDMDRTTLSYEESLPATSAPIRGIEAMSPQVQIVAASGQAFDSHYLAAGMRVHVRDGQQVTRGQLIASIDRDRYPQQAGAFGIQRLRELLTLKEPSPKMMMAEFDGQVEFTKPRGSRKQREIVLRSADEEAVFVIDPGRWIPMQSGDHVRAGDPLLPGVPSPCDVLRILGEPAAQRHLLLEIQQVYRDQGVEVASQHAELVVAALLRYVRITDPGDTSLVEGGLVEKSLLRSANRELSNKIRITDPGDSHLEGLISASQFDHLQRLAVRDSTRPPSGCRPRLARGNTELKRRAAPSSKGEGFLAAMLHMSARIVLRQAALAGEHDPLESLTANRIAGTLPLWAENSQ